MAQRCDARRRSERAVPAQRTAIPSSVRGDSRPSIPARTAARSPRTSRHPRQAIRRARTAVLIELPVGS